MFSLFEKAPSPGPAASRLRPSCFGKMPLHADFIRYNLTSRETGSFEKWLQEGVGCIARSHPKGWPPIYRTFPRHHFVWSGGEQENNLIGSLASSRDRSGRIYPFAALGVACAPLLHNHRATPPLVYRDYFHGAQDLIRAPWESASLATLTQKLEGLACDNPQLPQRELLEQQIQLLGTLPMRRYWETLATPVAPAEREQYWCAFYNVMKTVADRGPGRAHWGIRIPLPMADDQTPFVVFWVQMAESILENRFWRAHYFWNAHSVDCPACLTLFFRPLPPSYLLPLVNHDLDDNAVFDIGREWPSLPVRSSRVDLRRLLENDEVPLLEVLYRTGRREML